MSKPVMRSWPSEDYPGRFRTVDEADLAAQRAAGWPDFHPEDFCHRCGNPNVSWYIDSAVWNPVMRNGQSDGFGRWQEIVCIPCFVEVAEERLGGCAWRIGRDEVGSEVLTLLHVGAEVTR